jgi:hypothetical protein
MTPTPATNNQHTQFPSSFLCVTFFLLVCMSIACSLSVSLFFFSFVFF